MDPKRLARLSSIVLVLLATAAAKELEPEVPDQPPAKSAARDNPLARSAPKVLVRGAYVSVQVNVDGSGSNIVGDAANEPSIAVNPLNPSNLVIAWRQFDSIASNFRQAGWAYTFDKGQHWTFPGVLTPGVFRSDPVVDADGHGVFYYQSLKGNFLMDTFTSTNGGVTWGAPVPSFGGDKNWLVVDRTGGVGDGNQYGIWQRFASCCGTSVLTRSTTSGTTWENPVPVAMWPTFGTLAVGPDGTLYAAGIDGTFTQDFDTFVLARSFNAKNAGSTPTFDARVVDVGGSMQIGGAPNPAGLLGQGNVAVDRSNGPTRGHVYVLASVTTPFGVDPSDVFLARSTDGGTTFGTPVRVNDDAYGNWQWLAAHAVAPNGRIDAVWYDTRESGTDNISRLYYAYSWNGGMTWSPNIPVSPAFDSTVGWPQQSKMGDYTTLVSDETGADVAYAATFNHEQDVYYLRVFPDCNNNFISDVTDLAADTSLDCNLDRVPDECGGLVECLGAGSIPESGTPLTVNRAAGGAVALAWGPACTPSDDYAVYEGALGSFSSHAKRTCSTGGVRAYTLTPSAGDRYFLVVPLRADREGSYGAGAAGERSPAPSACRPQTIAACGP
ncbi:MAG TPA: sialidase family protein [Candidatus Bathyarchaeia archaeon]|nr:sialidase family protein [Candidatus Bathyarchaeia archaeon]